MPRLAALGVLGLTCVAAASARPPYLAFVVPCAEAADDNSLCLHGKHARGQSVMLLEHESHRSCQAWTASPRRVRFGKEFEATQLKGTGACGAPDAYHLAVVGASSVSYAPVPLASIEDEDEIRRLCDNPRVAQALAATREEARQMRGEYFAAALQSCAERLPSAYRVGSVKRRTLILQNQVQNLGAFVPGPVLVVGPTEVVALSPVVDLCAPRPTAFTLDGRLYLEAPSHCCDCGMVFERVVELTRLGPKVVLKTPDFSD